MGNWSLGVDEAIQFLLYSILENLGDFISNNSLYSVREKWLKEEKFGFQICDLPMVFAILMVSITKALNIVQHRRTKVEVTKLAEHRIMMIIPSSQPTIPSSDRSPMRLFSAAGCTEPKLV